MNISINKTEVKTKKFDDLKAGSLFTDPQIDNSPLYIKANNDEAIDLLTGEVEDSFTGRYGVIDVTDEYVIVSK